jgi:outer membrane protein
MEKLNNLFKYAPGVIALIGVIYLFLRQGDVNGVAFVRSEDLVYGYAGMKEIEQVFAAKEQGRKANLDTLSADFQREYAATMEAASAMSVEEKQEAQMKLKGKQSQLIGYSQAMQTESDEEEAKMLGSVLEQINSFVKAYAEAHGYDMVYGTTSDGNILYGEPGLDITDDLLKELNAHYYGEN